MNKKNIKKWVKKVGIVISSVIAIFLLYILFVIGYQKVYLPYHIQSLYQEGLDDPNKAEEVVKQLQNEGNSFNDAQEKTLTLIKKYAQKETLWAQLALEQYNEEHKIPIRSIIPINKYILGITLGKSDKEDVFNYLDKEELWHQELENGSVTQVYKDFEFAGIFWNYVNFHFTNNTVYKITFICKVEGSAKDFYIRIKNMLASKYTLSKEFSENSSSTFSIKDSNILIELKMDFDKLTLSYIDLKAKKEKLKRDTDSI